MTKKPVVVSNGVKSWSFSRYSDYCKCPLFFKLKHLDKIPEPKKPAMERGTIIHELCEDYVTGRLPVRMPPELNNFKEAFKELRERFKKKTLAMQVEEQWGFDREWEEVAWDDWNHCWARIKIDCVYQDDTVTARVIDYKTGKIRMEDKMVYMEQLELYALSILVRCPWVDKVIPALWYLDHGIIFPEVGQEIIFYRKDLNKLKALWEKRVKPMFIDKKFAPRPGNACTWCHYKKSSTGHCQY